MHIFILFQREIESLKEQIRILQQNHTENTVLTSSHNRTDSEGVVSGMLIFTFY